MARWCTALLAALTLNSITTFAQNYDVNAERVSMDMYLLDAIGGKTSMGSYAVWPQWIGGRRTEDGGQQTEDGGRRTEDRFGEYVSEYYRQTLLDADTTDGLLFAHTDSRFRGLAYNDGIVRLQGDLNLMVRPGYYDNDTVGEAFALLRPGVRFFGSVTDHLGFYLELTNGLRLAGDPRLIVRTDQQLSYITRLQQDDSSFFDRYIGYVQFQSDYIRIRLGREAMNFGFSPIGNFVHSIEAPLLDGLLFDVPYKSVRFTMTHSAANGTDTSGAEVSQKFIATHRIAIDPVPWMSVAISDMIVYTGRGLDLVYFNPLAFFVSAGLTTQERSMTDNSLLGIDLALRPIDGTMLYGAFMADDLNYSTLSDTSWQGTQNKFAWQVGISQIIPWLTNQALGTKALGTIEYARIDPFTFSHRGLDASYTTFNSPVGYDMQPNSDRWAFQLRTWFTPRTFVRIDFDYTRHGENMLDSTGNIMMGDHPRYPGTLAPIGNVGGDILRGDGDDIQGNRFLRGNVSYQRRLGVWFSAEWWTNIFTDVKIGYLNRNGGNTPESFFYGSFEIRVGY